VIITVMYIVHRAGLLPWSPSGVVSCINHWEVHLSCTVSTTDFSSGKYLHLWENYVCTFVHTHRWMLGASVGFACNTWHHCV